ncbi:penicillin-binding protein 2 [Mangrovicoccus algicola]|uniref:Penicillin-binding protein 2 n=1 Tax=Mangrovicoccus algicola TaxID=2771008 RepID=A0A8J6Z750_9RHOB|nr:penicillin-binding protein 2 [Mangrovicoccus algicola]MBE3639159.1 penicillin-binding protein 2 [Mangrovicoccus algicola]
MRRSEKDVERSAGIVTRRGLVLGGLQLAVMGTLGFRLRHMQVEQADEYRLLAEENRINVRLLAPQRGLIFDRNGRPIAENDQNYRVVIVREDAGDVEAVLRRLSGLIPLEEADIERTLREVARRSAFVPVTVRDQLPWEDLARVAINAPALPGVRPEVGQTRGYPLGQDFAHVIGYVGPVSDYDLSKLEHPDPLLQIPKFQIGKSGVEARMEDVLRGKAGASQIEVNAVGRVMRELSRSEGASGRNLQLTIDAGLQNFTQARLEGESAGVVVIDTRNGDIAAAVSSPSFDPNLFVRGISVADYRSLTENSYRPLASKTVQGAYPPGSTFKMVVALAGLEAGIITPDSREYCPGYLETGGRRFHCWRSGGHGMMNLTASLQQSCDVYYYEIAQKVGIDRIAAMAKRLGLGTRFDLPLSAIAEGIAPDKDWKRRSYGQEWRIGDTINASIGQGYVLASPLQLAVMTARIASGNAVMPRLIKTIDGVEQPVSAEPLGLNPRNLRAVQAGMDAVSNTNRGTGYGSRVADEALRIAGKSGTSQVRNISKAERARGVTRNDQLPWNRRDHALFVAYGPVPDPHYAVAVIVEHGGSGSGISAPIARDVLLAAMTGGVPPLSAYPSSQRDEVAARFEAMPMRPQFREKHGKSRA